MATPSQITKGWSREKSFSKAGDSALKALCNKLLILPSAA